MTKPSFPILATLLLGIAFASAANGQKTPGIAVGEKAPDFTLADQNGKETTLAKLREKGNVALVFYRSADW